MQDKRNTYDDTSLLQIVKYKYVCYSSKNIIQKKRKNKIEKWRCFIILFKVLTCPCAYLLSAFLDIIKNIMKQFAAMDKPATNRIIPAASSACAWHSTFVPFVELLKSRPSPNRGPPIAPLDDTTIILPYYAFA